MPPKITLRNTIAHLKKIAKHRRYVRQYCFKTGLYWQGLTHDLSKYSPAEFWESVRYYQGDKSPILACKADKDYSMAWFHHKGRNKHHWEYWVDEFDHGMVPRLMPEKYAIEMFCDFLAAGKAYMGDGFSVDKEFEWWKEKRRIYVLHPVIKDFIDTCFAGCLSFGTTYALDRDRLHRIYMTCKEENKK